MGFHTYFEISQGDSWWILSKAFLKSMKFREISVWNSMHCSIMLQSAMICSVHHQPLQNPTCSCQRFVSTAVCSCLSRTIEVFLGTDRRVMPHQVPHSLMLPFFRSFTMTPHFSFWVHIPQSNTCSAVMLTHHAWTPHFINSAVIQSSPGALLFFSVETAPSPSFSFFRPIFTFSFSGGVTSN